MSAPHISNSDNPYKNERYTPEDCERWCLNKVVLDRFDLDVAACVHAHLSDNYYTEEMNGLLLPWTGHVWCNPPYDLIRPWVAKAWDACVWLQQQTERALSVSMLLPATRTEQEWWQELVEPYIYAPGTILRIYHVPGRIKFGKHPDDTSKMTGSPFPCVLLHWRPT